MKATKVAQPFTDSMPKASVGGSSRLADSSRLPCLRSGQLEAYSRLAGFGFDVEVAEPGESGVWTLQPSRDGSGLWLLPAGRRLSEKVMRQSGIDDLDSGSWRQRLTWRSESRSAGPALRFDIPFEIARFYPTVSRDNLLVEVRKGDPVVSLHLFDARARSLGEVRCGAGDEGRNRIENERCVLEDLTALSLRSARTPRVLCQSEAAAHTLLFLESVTPRPAPVPARFTGAHQQFLDELEYHTRPAATAPTLLSEALLPVAAYLDHNRHYISAPCYAAANRLCGMLYAVADTEIPAGLGHGAFEPRHARLLNGELLVTAWRRAGYRRSLATELVRFLLALGNPRDPAFKRAKSLAVAIAKQWPGLSGQVVWVVLAFALLEILAEPFLYKAGVGPEREEVAEIPAGEVSTVREALLVAVEQGLRSSVAKK